MTTAENLTSNDRGPTDREQAIARVRRLVDTETLAIADRVAAMNKRYVGLDRDDGLANALNALVLSLTALDTSKPDKRRIVAVCGRSGAGKTTALAKHTSEIEAMKSYVDENGVEITPLLRFDAPSPCTPRRLAIVGLEKLGYPVKQNIRENEAWSLFLKMLQVHKVMFVLIDEAQHTIDTANSIEITTIGNAFKQMTQSPEWPVRLILAGVAPLATFLARKQIYNRRTVVTFDRIDGKTDRKLLSDVLNKIVCEHAQMMVDDKLDETFIERLAHAADGDFGSIIQMIRGAVEVAMIANDHTVSVKHFVSVYKSFSGCELKKNIFDAEDWKDLVPYQALFREEDRLWDAAQRKSPNKKVLPFGTRPE